METVLVTLFFIIATVTLFFLIRAFVLITINQIKEATFNEATEIQYKKMCDAGIPVRIRTDVMTGRKYTDIVPTYCDLELTDYEKVNKYGTHAHMQFFDIPVVAKEYADELEAKVSDDFLCTNCGAQALKSETDGEFCSVDCVREYDYHRSNAFGR